MRKQILTPLIVLFASASLLIAVPHANGQAGRFVPAEVGQPDPWLQNLNARARFENVQTLDPWQSNLYARKAYETRKLAATSEPASAGGFDWSDAGIGAGVVLGVLLVGATSVVTIRRNRQPLPH